jgi:hypothetical protein
MDGGVINHSNKAAYHTEKLSQYSVLVKWQHPDNGEKRRFAIKNGLSIKKIHAGQTASQASKLGTQSVVSQFRRIAARQGARRPAC